MLSQTEKSFALIFSTIVIAELIFDNIEGLYRFHYITKPLILIALLFFFWKYGEDLDKKTKQFTLMALLCSLIGDVLLMFSNISENIFIGGLIAFLSAHVFYIMVFLKKKNSANNIWPLLILLSSYAGGIFYLLKDGLGDLLIPIIVYMIVILSLGISAYFRRGNVSKYSFILIFLGAIFFIISDSLLALNKFYKPLPLSNLSIMITYSMAQLLIVLGIKKQL